VKRVFAALLGALALGFAAYGTAADQDARVAAIVREGKLRVAVGLAPAIATRDAATGAPRGVGVDLAAALAKRIGVPLELASYPSPPKTLDGLATRAWDLTFLGIDPKRAAQLEFSTPIFEMDYTFLAPADSPIQKIDDAAVPGFRIAVTRGSLGVDALAVRLPRAELVQVDSAAAGLEALRRGNVQLLASDRPNLLVLAQSFAGSRVLEDRYHTFRLAIAVPKGESAWLQYIDEFLAEARKTRVIEGAIQRAKLRGVQ
jgi:polar amino acid transport system substrate-binding protein